MDGKGITLPKDFTVEKQQTPKHDNKNPIPGVKIRKYTFISTLPLDYLSKIIYNIHACTENIPMCIGCAFTFCAYHRSDSTHSCGCPHLFMFIVSLDKKIIKGNSAYILQQNSAFVKRKREIFYISLYF